MSEGPALGMTECEHLVRAIKDGLRKIDEHDRKIVEHQEKIEEQETKRDEREVEVGTALKALKAQKPKGIKWEHYLEECGIEIHRSRADQLIRIADGRTTTEEERADTAERQAKSRAASPPRDGEDDPGASADAMKATLAALDGEPDDDDQTKEPPSAEVEPPRAEVAKLIRAWVQSSPEVKRQFIRERWDEIARVRKQLDANGHEDRWIEGDTL